MGKVYGGETKMNKKTKKKRFNFTLLFLLFAICPMLLTSIVLTAISIRNVSTNLESESFEKLKAVAYTLNDHFAPGYLANGEFDYDTAYVDMLKNQGIEQTIFVGDTRFVTSLLKDDGTRNEGSKSDAQIWADCQAGKSVEKSGVMIGGKEYFVYYLPIKDGSGKVIGMAFAGTPATVLRSAESTATWSSILFAVACIAIFSAIVVVLTKRIVAPLNVAANAATTIAEGTLDCDVDAKASVKETKMLISAVAELKTRLKKIISGVQTIADDVSESARSSAELAADTTTQVEQISRAVEDLAQGATALAQSVQDIVQQTVTLSETTSGIADSVEILGEASEEVTAANESATASVEKVRVSSEESVKSVKVIKEQIDSTNDSITKIDQAVEAIKSIASQTNLLALNASIEAARAGEAGKGFAVVAGEINNLSSESAASAEGISQVVQEIKRQSATSVELADEVYKMIMDQQEIIREVQDTFTQLKAAATKSTDATKRIQAEMPELDSVKSTIASSADDLGAVSEQNAASNQEVSASLSGISAKVSDMSIQMRQISEDIGTLHKEIKYFK